MTASFIKMQSIGCICVYEAKQQEKKQCIESNTLKRCAKKERERRSTCVAVVSVLRGALDRYIFVENTRCCFKRSHSSDSYSGKFVAFLRIYTDIFMSLKTSCDAGFVIAYIFSLLHTTGVVVASYERVVFFSLFCFVGKKQTKCIQRKNVNIIYGCSVQVKVRSGCVLCHLAENSQHYWKQQ